KTGAEMLLWDGACIVHEEFRSRGIANMKALYPDAAVLVHPESPMSVVEIADAVGSTSQLIKAAQTLPNQRLIVATDRGIFYKIDRKSTRLNSSHVKISYAVFCLKKKKKMIIT